MEGERFFDREVELEALRERIRDGTHTLLTAQRRMGKTSLVRELLRRLREEGEYETIFVDLEAAANAGDAIAEIAFETRSIQGVWSNVLSHFSNFLQGFSNQVEAVRVFRLFANRKARAYMSFPHSTTVIPAFAGMTVVIEPVNLDNRKTLWRRYRCPQVHWRISRYS